FGVVLAVCAFVGPSMASAASWSGLGTHQLLSTNLSFVGGVAPSNVGWNCAQSTFDTSVTNGADAAVIGTRFSNCRGFPGTASGSCTVTPTGSGFPWTATATATDNIQIHNIHVNMAFEALPGTAASECLTFGLQITLTGTLTGGSWNISPREILFTSAHGLTGHGNNGATLPALVSGTIRDIANSLNVIM
ncbi:MAG TPA: hypothetical protein VFY45_18970, partial [Baekduia sp.]|nr:hypothetical protein [Baekduia sp.]